MFGKRLGSLWGLGVALGVVAAPKVALARGVVDTTHVSLDGTLVSYQSVKVTADAITDPNSGESATPDPVTASSTSYGLLGSGFGIGLGYGLSDDVPLGVQAQVVSTKTSIAGVSWSGSSVRLLPRMLNERHEDSDLTDCSKIQVLEGSVPLDVQLTGRGEKSFAGHSRRFVAGVVPVHALTVLARPGSVISVCAKTWQLSAKARHAIHVFLAERHALTSNDSEPQEAEAVEPEPTEGSPADASPATPSASASGAAAPASPDAVPAPALPVGAAPASPPPPAAPHTKAKK